MMTRSGGTFITAEVAQDYGSPTSTAVSRFAARAERGSPIWQPV